VIGGSATLEVRQGGVVRKALERSGYYPQMTAT
jgi:hypothetical protein